LPSFGPFAAPFDTPSLRYGYSGCYLFGLCNSPARVSPALDVCRYLWYTTHTFATPFWYLAYGSNCSCDLAL